jgi:hypothetical protein
LFFFALFSQRTRRQSLRRLPNWEINEKGPLGKIQPKEGAVAQEIQFAVVVQSNQFLINKTQSSEN